MMGGAVMETRLSNRKSDQGCGSQAIQVSWSTAVVQI
jgi:hypothetical protein